MSWEVPRDCKGEYEPQIVKKNQTDISSIENKIIFLYSQGVSTRDIEKTMQEMYGIEVDLLAGALDGAGYHVQVPRGDSPDYLYDHCSGEL